MLRQEARDNPRKGGFGSKVEEDLLKRDIVIVDSREFGCLTPVYLHEKGFWLVPMVLTVGDYVLSDDICVERKSVSTGDLFESFRSGRLLTQITNMCRFFKRPILLIEFDESMPFKLYDGANDSAIGGDVNPTSIVSKISLLTLHFPQLQLLWSRGPAHTAELFKEIRRQTSGFLGGISVKDPDLQKIAKIGTVGGDEDAALDDENDDFKRFLPTEFLKRLPGVDSHSINSLKKHAMTVTDVVRMSEDDLKLHLGAKNGRELKAFLQRKVEVAKEGTEEDN